MKIELIVVLDVYLEIFCFHIVFKAHEHLSLHLLEVANVCCPALIPFGSMSKVVHNLSFQPFLKLLLSLLWHSQLWLPYLW